MGTPRSCKSLSLRLSPSHLPSTLRPSPFLPAIRASLFSHCQAFIRTEAFDTSKWIAPLAPPRAHASELICSHVSKLETPIGDSNANARSSPASAPADAACADVEIAVTASSHRASLLQLQPKKAAADAVEAVIGATWRCAGADVALVAMERLGVPCAGVRQFLRGDLDIITGQGGEEGDDVADHGRSRGRCSEVAWKAVQQLLRYDFKRPLLLEWALSATGREVSHSLWLKITV